MQTRQLLGALVSINSAFPGNVPDPLRPGEVNLAAFIEDWLLQRGFNVERQPVVDGRFNVLAEKGTGEKSLLLYGHMDTVPAVTGWQNDPWTPVIEGDRLYGLGAWDMKGGLCAIMRAAGDFHPERFKLKMAFLVDEENISEGAYKLIQSPWMHDVVAAMVPESGASERQTSGPRTLTLGRRGRVTIIIDVRGRSAHAAGADLGVSAAVRAAKIALAVDQLPLTEHPLLGPSSVTIRSLVSETHALSIPNEASITLDRHLVPPESPEAARQDVEALVARLYDEGAIEHASDMPITVTIPDRRTPYLQPYVTPVEHPFVQLVAGTVQDLFGSFVRSYGLSVADENYFGADLKLPVVVLGPAGEANHAPGEWVSLSSVDELTRAYRELLVRFDRFVVT